MVTMSEKLKQSEVNLCHKLCVRQKSVFLPSIHSKRDTLFGGDEVILLRVFFIVNAVRVKSFTSKGIWGICERQVAYQL